MSGQKIKRHRRKKSKSVIIKCQECKKTVYPLDKQVQIDGWGIFHQACCKCSNPRCGKNLTARNWAKYGDTLYCKTHYKEVFQASGGKYAGTDELRQRHLLKKGIVSDKPETEASAVVEVPAQKPKKSTPSPLSVNSSADSSPKADSGESLYDVSKLRKSPKRKKRKSEKKSAAAAAEPAFVTAARQKREASKRRMQTPKGAKAEEDKPKEEEPKKDMMVYARAVVAATKTATADRNPGPLQAALDEALGAEMPAKCAAAVKARKLLRKLNKQKVQQEEEAEAAAAKQKADQEEAEAEAAKRAAEAEREAARVAEEEAAKKAAAAAAAKKKKAEEEAAAAKKKKVKTAAKKQKADLDSKLQSQLERVLAQQGGCSESLERIDSGLDALLSDLDSSLQTSRATTAAMKTAVDVADLIIDDIII